MKSGALLERRAERGVARGAGQVWADARSDARSDTQPGSPTGSRASIGRAPGPVLGFRVAIAVAAFTLGIAAILVAVNRPTALTTAGDDERSDPDQVGDRQTSSEPGFAPLLLDDMELVAVQRPFDPEGLADDGDDILDRLFGPGEEVPQGEALDDPLRSQIFADPADPFNGPIVGIESLENDGFRPSGANLDAESLESYSNQLRRQGRLWSIEPESGLGQVDSLEGHPFDRIKFGWEFTFRDGSDEATLLIEPSEGRGVWVWLARSLRSYRSGFAVRSTEVLGHPAVLVSEFAEEPDGDHVYWADDEFVYRLTAARVDGFDSEAGPGSALLERLSMVDGPTWEAAVAEAERSTLGLGDLVAIIAVVAVLVLSALAITRLAARRRMAVRQT